MPLVKKYERQVSRTGPVLSSNVPGNIPERAPRTANDFGGARAQDIINFGRDLGQTARNLSGVAQALSEADKITASNRYVEANSEMAKYMIDADNIQGEDSMRVFDIGQATFEGIYKKNIEALKDSNQSTKEMFTASFNAARTSHMEKLAMMQSKNIQREKQKSLDLLNNNSIENAVLYKENPDAIALAEAEITANTNVQYKNAIVEDREQRVQDNISKLHENIINAYSVESPTKALAYLSSIEKDPTKINPVLVLALKDKLNKAAVEEQATDIAYNLSNSGMTLDDQLKTLDKQYAKDKNEKLYKEAKRQIVQSYDIKEAGEREKEEKQYDSIVYKLLADPYLKIPPVSGFNANHNMTIMHIQKNNLEELQGRKQDNMALYAKIKSGELKIKSISDFTDKYGGEFKNSTLKEIINWYTGVNNKDANSMQLMNSYQQATQNIHGIKDFESGTSYSSSHNVAANNLRNQFFTEFQRRLQQLTPEEARSQEKRQDIINQLLAPADETKYRFQLQYLSPEKKDKVMKDKDNYPEALKGYNNLQFDNKANVYYRDDDAGIRHIYDVVTGAEVARGTIKK